MEILRVLGFQSKLSFKEKSKSGFPEGWGWEGGRGVQITNPSVGGEVWIFSRATQYDR